jgi:carboxylesterase type B
VQENTTQAFLSLLNVSTIAEARNLSSTALMLANAQQVAASRYGGFSYGPVVDGTFVPALPSVLLNAGQFAKNVTVMVSHMLSEGPLFTPPNVQTDDELEAFILLNTPGFPADLVNYVVKTLYPARYDGSQPYSSPIERTILFITETSFTCNNYFLNKAYGNKTFAYQFAVPPGFHGFDIPYTFYNGQPTNLTAGMIAPVGVALGTYLTNFAMTGNPNGRGMPPFPMQGKNASMNSIGTTIQRVKDDTSNQRCAWWEKSLFA